MQYTFVPRREGVIKVQTSILVLSRDTGHLLLWRISLNHDGDDDVGKCWNVTSTNYRCAANWVVGTKRRESIIASPPFPSAPTWPTAYPPSSTFQQRTIAPKHDHPQRKILHSSTPWMSAWHGCALHWASAEGSLVYHHHHHQDHHQHQRHLHHQDHPQCHRGFVWRWARLSAEGSLAWREIRLRSWSPPLRRAGQPYITLRYVTLQYITHYMLRVFYCYFSSFCKLQLCIV